MLVDRQAGILAMSMTIAVMTLSAMAPAGAAAPDAPREDVFGRSTGQAPQAPIRGHVASVRINPPQSTVKDPHPQVSKDSPPQEWFDAFDAYGAAYRPSFEDAYVIQDDFNQEAEKVQKFCTTVAKVARNYRSLALKLKSLPIPASMPDVRTYRDRSVDWYNDSAEVYEDMVRPRPPAKTREELTAMIQSIKDRSESLKANRELLYQLDTEIRRHHHVNPPKIDDAIYSYAGHH